MQAYNLHELMFRKNSGSWCRNGLYFKLEEIYYTCITEQLQMYIGVGLDLYTLYVICAIHPEQVDQEISGDDYKPATSYNYSFCKVQQNFPYPVVCSLFIHSD